MTPDVGRGRRAASGARVAWVALLAIGLATSLGAACTAFQGGDEIAGCANIPEGGCPGTSSNCQDTTCAAIYTCELDGGWSLATTCTARDAGPDTGAHDARADVSLRRDADWDVPPGASGGPGCTDLQLSDCTLTEALLCPSNECCCCQTLFVCDDGGWNVWGQCLDGGELMPTPALGSDE